MKFNVPFQTASVSSWFSDSSNTFVKPLILFFSLQLKLRDFFNYVNLRWKVTIQKIICNFKNLSVPWQKYSQRQLYRLFFYQNGPIRQLLTGKSAEKLSGKLSRVDHWKEVPFHLFETSNKGTDVSVFFPASFYLHESDYFNQFIIKINEIKWKLFK